MAKEKTVYICLECGHQEAKWVGRCSKCQTWNSFEEQKLESSKGSKKTSSQGQMSLPMKINDIENISTARIKTGINELDRVMGGGITLGSLSLIGGEPGIGKSTLLMHICHRIAQVFPSKKILYVSGEESQSQVASRCRRLGVNEENIYILHETNWQEIEKKLKEYKPVFVVIDSVQTTVSHNINSTAGSVSQVKEITYELMNYSKAHNVTSFLIGHITKEGGIAGPKVLEHMVDTVISFEGDLLNHYRMLRVLKNRFGNTSEVGIFEMTAEGLVEIKNPSMYFIDHNAEDAFGSSLTCLLEGNRPLLVEIQALAIENKFGNGRRTTQGYDSNRLALLVAVLEKYLEIPMTFNDIYLNIVSGLKVSTRESDLAVMASLLSSYYKKPMDKKVVFLGELGLTGEVRAISMIEQRLKEISALSFETVLIPEANLKKMKKTVKNLDKSRIKIIGVKNINELNDFITGYED